MKRIFSLAASLIFSAGLFAQTKLPSARGVVEAAGYGNGIVKITVHGSRAHSEQVSDAVIGRPDASLKPMVRAVGGDAFELQNDSDPIRFSLFQTGDTAGFRFVLGDGDRIFGGGERALPLNRRGYRLTLNNNPWYGYGEGADNLNYSVPYFTSSAGYALFFDNPARSYADIGKKTGNLLEWGAPSGEWSVYVIFGDYAQTLASYHKLTGTQPLPPRWAFGNLMSRFGYTSQAQVTDIVKKMKDGGFPVDAVIFDLFWFGDSIKGTMGNLDWVNRQKWPDPKGMIADFKKDDIKTILITEPFLVETSKNYEASKPYLATDSAGKPYLLKNFYFGRGGLIDIFRKDAKAWFWPFYRRQMALGVEAWWGDLGEPEQHPSDLYHNLKDYGFSRRFRADEVHNIYGHAWTKMLYEYYAKEYPQKRLFSLNRSGFAGSQRYGIFPWTGDVSRSWSGLRAQLPTLLGMAMSGVPYVHSDAGGFAGGDGDGELYTRWLQFAVFTPIFRPHGTALYEIDKGSFSFPSEAALVDMPWRGYAREAIQRRYELLPYNYSLAYRQARTGAPLIAPLYYYNPGDTAAAGIQDEYYWGPSILVAPVLEKGAAARRVYLPAGQWLDLDGKLLDGGRWHTVPVTMERIPVFIKAGALIPGQEFSTLDYGKESNRALKKGTATLLYVASEKTSSFDWYLDDGASKNALATGNYTLLRCTAGNKAGGRYLKIAPSNTRYKLTGLNIMVPGVSEKPRTVLVNGKQVRFAHTDGKSPQALWNEDRKLLSISVPAGIGNGLVVETRP